MIGEWVLILSLCSGCSGKAQSAIEMESREACMMAAAALRVERSNSYAACLNRKTGELLGGQKWP